MHAIGHVAANLSFAAVAISLTHTVKTLEPVFSVILSKVVLGQATPLPVVGTLIPVMVRQFLLACCWTCHRFFAMLSQPPLLTCFALSSSHMHVCPPVCLSPPVSSMYTISCMLLCWACFIKHACNAAYNTMPHHGQVINALI